MANRRDEVANLGLDGRLLEIGQIGQEMPRIVETRHHWIKTSEGCCNVSDNSGPQPGNQRGSEGGRATSMQRPISVLWLEEVPNSFGERRDSSVGLHSDAGSFGVLN